MNTNGQRQVLGPAGETQRAPWEQAGQARTGKKAGAAMRDTLFKSHLCVALLAAFLVLPAGQASTENYLSGSGDCDAARIAGGIFPAMAGSQSTPFNAVFGLNAMAKGDAASPFPFR
jgi:hypothetical protein